jgi:hypothetical protein
VERTVPCGNLSHFLALAGVGFVDLLSVDVEGSELAVLETLDFAATPVHVVLLELTGRDPSKDARCRQLLAQNGFELAARLSEMDEAWEHPGRRRWRADGRPVPRVAAMAHPEVVRAV